MPAIIFPMPTTGELLREMYKAMHARFAHQAWWPASGEDRPQRQLEIAIGAILTQNTNWRNVEKAIANLRAAGELSVSALLALPQEALAELIRPAGYYNVKAKRLRNFLRRVHDRNGDDVGAFLDRRVDELREDLLSISGVGRETADSIILYAAELPTFVVDAYTARIMLRHRLIDEWADYEQIKELFESNLPADAALFNDYHAQLVAVGKQYCRPVARCEGCPLECFPHDRHAGTAAE